jgi:phosphoribosylformimino-5-aminoimidazole carboxamide ribonucleotide (ProFAR) isomerase
MRVGATILFLNGYCYQSYGWKRVRPLGELQGVIDSLEKYEVDEVAIIRPVREVENLESFRRDIDVIGNLNSMTPISFGGGLNSIEHIKLLHQLPIERLIFSSAFIEKNSKPIKFAQKLFGHQSIQALIPFRNREVFLSKENRFLDISKLDFEFLERYANEVILFDTENEGTPNSFQKEILEEFQIGKEKIVISGGVGLETVKFAKEKSLASALIENRVLHKEFSIRSYKNGRV